MAAESYIQGLARFIIGFGTEQDHIWRDYNLDFAGRIDYDGAGNPVAFAPVGNSGYSLGSLQWDFGQGPDLAGPFVESFEAWFDKKPPNATPLKSDPEFATRAVALQGKVLTPHPALGLKRQDVQALSEYVRTDDGSDWVNANIDLNLIGSDAQPKIIVLGKTHGFTLVGIARMVEKTKAFKDFDAQHDVDATDLIYAIGMKTYNQSPANFNKKLMSFLASHRTLAELQTWYQQFSGGLKSGVGAATDLSTFWSGWRKANAAVAMLAMVEKEMTTQWLANPVKVSRTRPGYVIAKQVFEDTGRFHLFAKAVKDQKDFIDSHLFDAKTGAILLHPVTKRLRPGLLVRKKTAYAWDAVGNAYSSASGAAWAPFPVASINIKTL
jgi:hypothetical protein